MKEEGKKKRTTREQNIHTKGIEDTIETLFGNRGRRKNRTVVDQRQGEGKRQEKVKAEYRLNSIFHEGI